MTAYVYDDTILVVDSGLMFPEEEMLGVDIVIPDITFLEENSDKIAAILLTHGHEDHIGALPYVLRRIDVPVWGTKLTLGFVNNKLSEHKLSATSRLNEYSPGDNLEFGPFKVEVVGVSHSIPGAVGLLLRTPVGLVAHTGDFKFDQSPVDGNLTDFGLLAKAGVEGVQVLMCDVTNVEKPGFTTSESSVGQSFDGIFAGAPGRILVASFASNIHRVQQVYNIASKYSKKVVVIGRSMAANCKIAEDLGYLHVPINTRASVNDLENLPHDQVVVMTTGSQGEPLSALSKMAQEEHKHIKIQPGDTVIISASAIPGNENLVYRTINRLFKHGAQVLYEPFTKVHTSGHGSRDDIRLMINLLRPKYVIPVHGEQRHIAKFQELARGMGYSDTNIIKLSIGDVLEVEEDSAEITGSVQSGSVMVDGIGVGDVEDFVLRDRMHLSQDGIVICVVGLDVVSGDLLSGPDVFSRGFAVEEAVDEWLDEAKDLIIAKLDEFEATDYKESLDEIKTAIRKAVGKLFYEKTRRRPVIVPIIMEI